MPGTIELPLLPEEAIALGPWLAVVETPEELIVMNASGPLMSGSRQDATAKRYLGAVFLSPGLAQGDELAAVLGIHRSTLFRHRKLYREGGLEAIRDGCGHGAPRCATVRRGAPISSLTRPWRPLKGVWMRGGSPSAAARAVGVNETAIRHAIKSGRRRQLAELGGRQQAAQLAAALTAQWARGEPDELGILYVDGHVNVYTGRQHPLPKTLVPKRRQCLPAATDVGVHNGAAEPLFFVTSPINAHLLTLLEEAVIPDARRQIGPGRPLTLVFDREAWSPKSFRQWHRQGIDVITYRKGKQTPWDPEDFRPLSVTRDGQPVTYGLAERSVQVIPATGQHRAFWMREIRRLCHNGHQTAILTTRQDLPAEEIADRMFGRWRQENFFKYMPREFDIDHLSTYATEPADPERVVPNPERRQLEKLLKAKQAQLGRAHVRQAKPNATAGHQKDPHQEMIERLGQEGDQRRERLHAMAKRVPLKSIHEADQIVHHERERKTITPLIKVVAYRSESALARLVEPWFARHDDEIRAFLKAVFR